MASTPAPLARIRVAGSGAASTAAPGSARKHERRNI